MEIHAIRSKKYGGMLNQKSYVLISGNDAIIIDAGAEVQNVKEVTQGKNILAVLLTHLHFDHICCIEDYVKEWDADVYVAQGAEDKFSDPEKNCSYLTGNEQAFNVPQKNIKYYADKLKIGEFEIEVISTPGHSEDSVCLLIDKNLFCGDLVLGGTTGRCDLYGGSYTEMQKSLAKLELIDFEMAYPGHYDRLTKDEVLNSF